MENSSDICIGKLNQLTSWEYSEVYKVIHIKTYLVSSTATKELDDLVKTPNLAVSQFSHL